MDTPARDTIPFPSRKRDRRAGIHLIERARVLYVLFVDLLPALSSFIACPPKLCASELINEIGLFRRRFFSTLPHAGISRPPIMEYPHVQTAVRLLPEPLRSQPTNFCENFLCFGKGLRHQPFPIRKRNHVNESFSNTLIGRSRIERWERPESQHAAASQSWRALIQGPRQ